MATVLVAGAAGYLGRYATIEFRNRGYRVLAFVRDPEKLKQPGRHLEPPVWNAVDGVRTGDVTKPETLREVCDGVDIVFSSIGLTRPDKRVTSEDVDHIGNRNLLDAAIKAGVRKFVYVSVFRPEAMAGSNVVTAHERFVRDLKASGIDYAVLRPNAYFSDMSIFLRLAGKGRIVWLGNGRNRINPIHGEDLAKVCADAAEGSNREIDAGGPEMFTFRSLFELAFRAAGRKPRITFIPLWVGRLALGIIRQFSRKLAGDLAFFVQASTMQNDAPPFGSHRLHEYFREIEASGILHHGEKTLTLQK